MYIQPMHLTHDFILFIQITRRGVDFNGDYAVKIFAGTKFWTCNFPTQKANLGIWFLGPRVTWWPFSYVQVFSLSRLTRSSAWGSPSRRTRSTAAATRLWWRRKSPLRSLVTNLNQLLKSNFFFDWPFLTSVSLSFEVARCWYDSLCFSLSLSSVASRKGGCTLRNKKRVATFWVLRF